MLYVRTERARGNLERARRLLLRAIARSPDGCPDCHRELAAIYETQGLLEAAIAEWRSVITLARDKATRDEAARQVEMLTLKTSKSGAGEH